LLFHDNNGYVNTPQCYFYTYIACLVYSQFHTSFQMFMLSWNICQVRFVFHHFSKTVAVHIFRFHRPSTACSGTSVLLQRKGSTFQSTICPQKMWEQIDSHKPLDHPFQFHLDWNWHDHIAGQHLTLRMVEGYYLLAQTHQKWT
jgi:hypothetical protein